MKLLKRHVKEYYDRIIVDGNSLMYFCFYAGGENLKAIENKIVNIGCIPFFIRMLRKFETKCNKLIIVWDSNYTRKINLFAEYKGNRIKKDESIPILRKRLRILLKEQKFVQCICDGEEADDVIVVLSRNATKSTQIVATDHDFFILLDNPNITLYLLRERLVVDRNVLCTKYNTTPKDHLQKLCLIGKQSNNVPGIPGIGKIRAERIIESNKFFVERILDNDIVFPEELNNVDKHTITSLRACNFYEIVKLNYKLLGFPPEIDNTLKLQVIK